jgi:hypothetical protein
MKTEAELRKMKIETIRIEYPNIPKKLKKKDEIVKWVLEQNEVGTTAVLSSIDSPKRIKVAPVFIMSSSTSIPTTMLPGEEKDTSCRLCNGERNVWSELGLAVCPLCAAPQSDIPAPSIKQEPGVTSLPYTFDASGNIVLKLGAVDPNQLCDLVQIYGFGICEALEALLECDSVEEAADRLVEQNRSSAENSSIAEAQLNSEELREGTKRDKKMSLENARNQVQEDVSILLDIDSSFCQAFVFRPDGDSSLIEWMITDQINILLVFDYLVLRRDSLKWYKRDALKYFEGIEQDNLNTVEDKSVLTRWFGEQIEILREALYEIPETGGAIPLIFRKDSSREFTEDEIEVLCESQVPEIVVDLD